MDAVTGRYRLKETIFGNLRLLIEVANPQYGFRWVYPRPCDLAALEPMVRDGFRFPEERNGFLDHAGTRHIDD